MHKKLIAGIVAFRVHAPSFLQFVFNFSSALTLIPVGVIEFPEMHQHFNRI